MTSQASGTQDFKTLLQERTTHKALCRVGRMVFGSAGVLHWHENYEICQIIKGGMRFLVDGVNYELAEGDLICIDAAVPHLSFATEEDTVFRLFKGLSSNFMQISPSLRPLKVHITRREQEEAEGFLPTLNTLFETLTNKKDVLADETRPLEQALSASVYFLIMEYFSIDGEKYESKNKERKIFFKTLDYVNAHFTEPINVSVLSKELFYPRGKLSAIFTKYSGARLGDYINGLRVQRANELLSAGESITNSAFLSGFQNIRSFNNIYKDIMGQSPSEFLKRNA